MTRRQFALGIGTALAGASLPAPAKPNRAIDDALPVHLVYDARLIKTPAPFDAIATVAQHAFAGDVTTLWQNVLHPLWGEGRSATLGYTRHAEFFVLSTLARDHGYTVTDEQQLDGRCWWRIRPRRHVT